LLIGHYLSRRGSDSESNDIVIVFLWLRASIDRPSSVGRRGITNPGSREKSYTDVLELRLLVDYSLRILRRRQQTEPRVPRCRSNEITDAGDNRGAVTVRVLFDVTHPAHVHLFKNAIRTLEERGETVAVVSREKEMTTDLLDAYDIEHTVLSSKGQSQIALLPEWTLREIRTIRFARSFDPDVIVSRLVPSAVHAAQLLGAGSVVFSDHEHSNWIATVTAPLTDYYCTPPWFNGDFGAPHVYHDGVQELAYLHPNRFSPDHELLRTYGVDPDDPYFVLRFVSMGAHHDVTRDGMSDGTKRTIADRLSDYGDVYVSTEGPFPDDVTGEAVPVPPESIHHLLAEANLLVTDSNTVAAEAGVLGTPTIRSNSYATDGSLGNFERLSEYGLVVSTADEWEALERSLDLAMSSDAGETWERRRDRFLEESADITGFMIDCIDDAGRSRTDAAPTASTERTTVGGGVGDE